MDKNKIIEKIEEIIAPYQEPIELDALSLPTAIESILERLQTENEELKQWQEDAENILKAQLNNFDKIENRYKQALEEIKEIWEKDEDGDYDFIKLQTLNVINEVLKDD